MKRKEEIITDALSGINEETIDRNTEKRVRLISHPKVPRSRIISITALAAALAIVLSVVLILAGGGSGGGGGNTPVGPGQVPIYEGMTVSDSFTAPLTASLYSRRHEPMLNPKHPDKNDIKKNGDVKDALTVQGSTETLYYATVDQDVYVTVHINNPDQYEILSFTLNGKTYSSYMFEEGSDMENLVLKVNVGSVTGIKEYTIDAIKYVDGTEIKDVRMLGDRTVSISVGDGTEPSARVETQVGYYDLKLTVEIDDVSEIVEYYGNNVFAILSDENGEIINLIRIDGTEGEVTFDGLTQGTDYAYSIVAVYKSATDTEPDVHVLDEGVISTVSGLDSLGAVWQESTASFNIILDAGERVSVDSVVLLDGETVVLTLDAAALQSEGSALIPMSALLYNHAYSLLVSYTLDGESYTQSLSISTATLAVPTVSLTDVTVGENDMTVTVSVSDTDRVANKLVLTVGGTVVYEYLYTDTARETSFTIPVTALDDSTSYYIIATLSYDLGDGEGERRATASKTATTLATVTATEMLLRNIDTVYVGGRLIVQINLDNDSSASVSHVVINGTQYAVASTSTATVLNVEIDTAGFASGTHTLTLDSLVHGGRTVPCTEELSVNATLAAKFAFKGISIVGENYESKACYDYGEELYLVITLEGGEGSTLTSVVCRSDLNNVKDVTLDGLVKVDDNHYRLPLSKLGSYAGVNSAWVSISSLTYVKNSQQTTLNINYYKASASILPELSDEVVYIYDADDLKNVDDGYHYVLANDIDLGGANWTPVVFKGSLDGNGYAIKNFTCVGDENSTTGFIRESVGGDARCSSAGLFYSADGIVYNLRFEGLYVNINHYIFDNGSNAYSFGDSVHFNLFGTGTHTLLNCAIDDTSSITLNNTNNASDYSTLLIKLFSGQSVTTCASYANISMSVMGIPNANIHVIDADAISDCIIGGRITLNTGNTGYGQPYMYLPALTSCYNESTVIFTNTYVKIGDEDIYYGYATSGSVEFTGDGYRASINDGYGTVIEVEGAGIPKPTIPILQKKEKEMVVNLEINEYNCGYAADGETLVARMGLTLSELEIPDDVTTLVIMLPDNYNGIPISHIDFVRISYDESTTQGTVPYKVRVVIPDGVTTLGRADVSESLQYSFLDGTIHEVVIPDSVTTVYPYFASLSYLDKVYCVADSRPEGWTDGWNDTNATVEWGYTEE